MSILQHSDAFLADWDEMWARATKGPNADEEAAQEERDRRYRAGIERRMDWIVKRLEGAK